MILKLRFTTETSQEATFEDLVNFAFAPTTAFTDAPWTGQVCSDQHVLQYSHPLSLGRGVWLRHSSGRRLLSLSFQHCTVVGYQ